MDTTIYMIIAVGLVLSVPFGWLIGRWQDLEWRVKRMRQFFPKDDYRLCEWKYPGNINTYSRVVNLKNGSTFYIGSKLWIVAEERMYIKNNQNNGILIPKLNEKAEYDNGCPTIYINAESGIPLAFVGDNINVNPEKIGSTLDGYFLNQYRKQLLQIKNLQNILLIILFVSLVVGYFGYTTNSNMAVLQTNMSSLSAKMDTFQNMTFKPTVSTNPPVIKAGG